MKKFILLILFFFSGIVFSQSYSVSGRITDENGNPLPGANVIIQGTLIGTAANANGQFEIKGIKTKTITVEISMIGYEKFISDKIDLEKSGKALKFILNPAIFKVDQIIVTGNKRPQKLSSLPVSALFINGDEFSRRNFTKLDDALRYEPGINFALDQVSIRGSSGFSRGAGTRVLVALDGIPIYSADSGEIIWEIVPVTEIERVEVIKGASSTLYGSTAIGGVINVISKKTSSKPVTLVRGYAGLYDKPSYEIWDWSGEYRGFNGMTISHSNSFGNLGVSASFSRIEDMSYRQGDWRKRYSGYLKTKYDFNKNSSLTLLANGYIQDRGTFNYWKDSRNALIPPDQDQNQRIPSQRFILGGNLNQIISEDFSFSVKGNLFRSIWGDDSESSNHSNSTVGRSEIQMNYTPVRKLNLIAGTEYTGSRVNSNIFGANSGNAVGAYFQGEYTFSFPVILTAGVRFDNTKLDSIDAMNSFSPKFGINYHPDNATTLRAFFGKAFRAPTLAETFTSTTTSGITIKPNLNLKPETSYSLEFGVNRQFGKFLELDVSVFQNEFYDLIEPTLDKDVKIVFENVTRAKIQGMEITGGINLAGLNTKLNIGYTYLWARDVNANKSLKYRPRHSITFSADYNSGPINLGADFRYWSKVEEIDLELIDLGIVPDGEKMVDAVILDFNAGYSFYSYGFPLRIFINLNNVLNYNYAEMIGNIAPIRNLSLNLEFMF